MDIRAFEVPFFIGAAYTFGWSPKYVPFSLPSVCWRPRLPDCTINHDEY